MGAICPRRHEKAPPTPIPPTPTVKEDDELCVPIPRHMPMYRVGRSHVQMMDGEVIESTPRPTRGLPMSSLSIELEEKKNGTFKMW